MTLVSFTTAQSILMALLVFSVLAAALQMIFALGHRLYQVRHRMARARIVAAYMDSIIELLAGEVSAAKRREFIAALPTGATDRAIVIELLLSSVAKVRGEARATATRVLEEAGLTTYYLRRLRKRAVRERALAAEMLGEMRAISAKHALLAALRDRSPVVRVVAARALGKLGQPAAVPKLLAEYASGRLPSGIVSTSLLHLGPAAGPALQTRLHDGDPRVRALAARLIGLLDWTPAAGDLVALLGDDDAATRVEAAASLGRLGTENATEPLLARLSDASPDARVAAAEALGRLGDPDSCAGLAAALEDPRHEVRAAAASALVALGAPGLRMLADITRRGTSLARAYAVEALQRAGEDERIGPAGTFEPAPETLPVAAPARTDTRVAVEPAWSAVVSVAAARPPSDGAVRPESSAPMLEPLVALDIAAIGALTLEELAEPSTAERPAPLM